MQTKTQLSDKSPFSLIRFDFLLTICHLNGSFTKIMVPESDCASDGTFYSYILHVPIFLSILWIK